MSAAMRYQIIESHKLGQLTLSELLRQSGSALRRSAC
jgi:hypothetical protein